MKTPSFSGLGASPFLVESAFVSILFAPSFARSSSPSVARTVPNVRAIAVTAVTRVLVLVITDQRLQDRMSRTPPENREVEIHLLKDLRNRHGVSWEVPRESVLQFANGSQAKGRI